MHPINFTVVGDEGRAPDCVVLMAHDGAGGVVQRTLARGSDDGWAFWTRIMDAGRELLPPLKPFTYPFVAVTCLSGVDAERALRTKDKFANYQHSLRKTMHIDPSHDRRVAAACELAHLLGMDREMLQ
jgi:hypothetical protein